MAASVGKKKMEREESKKAFEEIRITRFAGFNEGFPLVVGITPENVSTKRGRVHE